MFAYIKSLFFHNNDESKIATQHKTKNFKYFSSFEEINFAQFYK